MTDDQRTIAMAKLLEQAQAIIANSTSPAAVNFDVKEWLAQWLERPHPALGWRTPADLISTPNGFEAVSRVLGSIESGSYQ